MQFAALVSALRTKVFRALLRRGEANILKVMLLRMNDLFISRSFSVYFETCSSLVKRLETLA